MLPSRFGHGPAHQLSARSFGRAAQQARHVAGTSKRSGASRLPVVVASCRLVLRPTGNGSSQHLGGDEVALPGSIPLNEGIFEVGRASPADIKLPIPTVSSRHALLRVEANRVSITDLNSTNGTLVNGQELTPMDDVELGVGSEVIFGDMFLARFQLDEVPDQQADVGAMAQQLSDQLSQHPNNNATGG